MFAVLTDITSNYATVSVVSSDSNDLFDALEDNEQNRLVRAPAGSDYATEGRVRVDHADLITDPGASL